MIVVDTNVIAYLLLPSVWTTAAEKLFQNDRDWAMPVLWRSELRNILTGYVRRGALSLESAIEIQHAAQERGCTAYDCEFVALAQQTQSQLYTMDSKVLKAFAGLATPLTRSA